MVLFVIIPYFNEWRAIRAILEKVWAVDGASRPSVKIDRR